MRLTYVGNFRPSWSTENDIRKAFTHLGWEVIKAQENEMSWQDIRFHALNSDLLLWTSTWDDAQPLKETIETVRLLGLKKIPSATVHLDVFHNTDRGGRKWWLNPMWEMAYVFTASGDYNEEWKAMGVNHIWLPPAIRHDACHFGEYTEKYVTDVAFVGSDGKGYHESEWPYRKELVSKLREICVRNGWSFRNPGGDHPKIERSGELNNFYASAKVIIGDSLCLKKEDSKYWSDRVPETTGRGGFLIMPQINKLKKMYGSNVPLYQWGNWHNLELTIKKYLNNPDEREDKRIKAQKITATQHTYVKRVEKLLERVGL